MARIRCFCQIQRGDEELSTGDDVGNRRSSGFAQCSMVMFDAISACNHSCDPNAEVSQVSDEGEVTLYSLRTIEPGEEITICYGKPSMRWLPARCRRRALRKDWCFECSCEKCVAEIASGLAVNKPMSRPWDILDPRWFFCTHDYATGFESHFDTEGNLLAMKTSPSVSTNTLASMIGEDVSSSALSASDILYRDFDGKIKLNGGRTDDHGTDDDDLHRKWILYFLEWFLGVFGGLGGRRVRPKFEWE